MPEVEITCIQCKVVFVFSEKEQDQFYQRNMMPPQRCAKCRSKKTAKRPDAPVRYEMVCDHCGKHDRVPFQPKVGRAVLCKECFDASRSKHSSAKH
jgi:CxxC-x17-CxxC domain-containing protein